MDSEPSIIRPLIKLFSDAADPGQAEPMKRYMRDQFDFLGIKTPARRALLKDYVRTHRAEVRNRLRPVVLSLWRRQEREYQYAAVDLLDRFSKDLTPHDLPMLETLITSKSWWDTVDGLATKIVGDLLDKNPASIEPNVTRWRASDNFWIRRTAILFQLKFRERTDERLLFSIVRENADSSEFFIQKAIGWALREYSKTEAESVRRFVLSEPLAPLSKREALKWLRSEARSHRSSKPGLQNP